MGMALPPLGDESHTIPAFTRIVTRGTVSEVRSDISSLELFSVSLTTSLVDRDGC